MLKCKEKGVNKMANICPCTFGNSISHALNNLRNAKKFKEQGPEQTGTATVLSRRVDTCYQLEKTDSSWGYFVTFKLENGEALYLKTTETEYKQLKEGQTVTIFWQGDTLTSFIIELG